MSHEPLPIDLGSRVGLIGDSHGHIPFLQEAICELADRGATSIVQLGDFGVIWTKRADTEKGLALINDVLELVDADLYVVVGNHEGFDLIATYPADERGCRRIGRTVILPRAGRMTAAGRPAGFLSGAASVDRSARRQGIDWWATEVPTDEEVRPLLDPPGHVDILLAHEAVIEPRLEARNRRTADRWDRADLKYARDAQVEFTRRTATVVTPAGVVVSGHHHHRAVAEVELSRPDGSSVTVRSEILAHEFSGHSLAILDVGTLELTSWQPDESRRRRVQRELRDLLRHRPELKAEIGVDRKTLARLLGGHVLAPESLLRRLRSAADRDVGGQP